MLSDCFGLCGCDIAGHIEQLAPLADDIARDHDGRVRHFHQSGGDLGQRRHDNSSARRGPVSDEGDGLRGTARAGAVNSHVILG